MKQINKRQLTAIEKLSKLTVYFMPEDYVEFQDIIRYKVFFVTCLTLYRELGILADFTFEVYPLSADINGSGSSLPRYTFDDISDPYEYAYDHTMAFGELSCKYVMPAMKYVGWSIDTHEDAVEVIEDACSELNIENIGVDWDEEEELWPMVVQSCKWRSFFNILRSDKALCRSRLAKKLFTIIKEFDDFCQCWFTGDESFFTLNQGIQFHFFGFSNSAGIGMGEECLNPFFPAVVLWAEYYMWELAKIKPELMSVMMSYEQEDAVKA